MRPVRRTFCLKSDSGKSNCLADCPLREAREVQRAHSRQIGNCRSNEYAHNGLLRVSVLSLGRICLQKGERQLVAKPKGLLEGNVSFPVDLNGDALQESRGQRRGGVYV